MHAPEKLLLAAPRGYCAGVDRAVPDQAGQLGQEPAHRRGTAEQVHLGVEQLRAGQLDAVSDTEVADVPAGAGRADGLHH